jgi:hypothetical protein
MSYYSDAFKSMNTPLKIGAALLLPPIYLGLGVIYTFRAIMKAPAFLTHVVTPNTITIHNENEDLIKVKIKHNSSNSLLSKSDEINEDIESGDNIIKYINHPHIILDNSGYSRQNPIVQINFLKTGNSRTIDLSQSEISHHYNIVLYIQENESIEYLDRLFKRQVLI